MSRAGRRPACVLPALLLSVLLLSAASVTHAAAADALSEPTLPTGVFVVTGAGAASPPPPAAPWQHVTLPDDAARSRPAQASEPAWYRIDFERQAPVRNRDAPWSVYLPYLYHGGSVWLNGALLADLPVSSEQVHVLSHRPRLVALPAALLHAGHNKVAIFVAYPSALPMQFPRVRIGPATALQPLFDQRLFWARTAPHTNLHPLI